MKILIGDDHSILRKGLKAILIEEFPEALIEEANDGAEVLKRVIKEDWSVIICDISMPGRSGLEIVKDVRDIKPNIPLLILSAHDPEHYAVRALKAGASGYVTKESASEELVNAVKQVIKGQKYVTPQVAQILAGFHFSPGNAELHQTLSDREFDVLRLIASGKTVSQIAEILSLSVNTVSTYRTRILDKMKMETNAELTKYAISNNLA
jgi:DNA-binding NarL/FixJ family response regulator